MIPYFRGLNPNFLRYDYGLDSSLTNKDRLFWENIKKFFDMANLPTDFYFATTDSNCPPDSH